MTGSKLLALIPARSGSKRLADKNLLELGGLPLIAHTIRAARSVPRIARVLVSTDSPAIADVARAHGAEAPFLRPEALATDAARSIDVALHALDWLAANESWEPTHVALLQPTSPLRTARHLEEAIDLLESRAPDGAVVSITEAKPAGWLFHLGAGGLLSRVLPATEAAPPPTVIPNGAIYLTAVGYLRQHTDFFGPAPIGYLMPSDCSVDIDTELDFWMAERLLRRTEGKREKK